MSQLQQFSPDADKSNKPVVLTWQDFVQVVLALTVEAYQTMKITGIARAEWDEDDFSVFLEEHIRPIAYNHDYPIFIHSRKKQHTKEMKAGQQRTKTAKETDLFLHGSWESRYDKIHFVWEAKRIGDKKTYNSLSSEYINEGIYRFIDNEYAQGLGDAGMIGYVLSGNVVDLVNDINSSMGTSRKERDY